MRATGMIADPPGWAVLGVIPVQFLATWIGNLLIVRAPSASAFWPATGTLIAALMIIPRHRWPAVIACALVGELAAQAWSGSFPSVQVTVGVAIVNMGQALLGAWLLLRFVGERIDFARVRPTYSTVLLLFGATFVGSLFGAWLTAQPLTPRAYWANQQAWWLSGFLGAIVLVPLLISWLRPPVSHHQRAPVDASLAFVQFAVLAIVLVHVFSRERVPNALALDSPVLVYAVMLWMAIDFGPRRMTLALLMVVIASLGYTLAGRGGFALMLREPFLAVLKLQGFLVVVVVPLLVAQALISEKRETLRRLRASDARYRAFIANSSEAIFRIEISPPAPKDLEGGARAQWVGTHAWIAEANDAFRALPGETAAAPGAGIETPVTGPVAPIPAWLNASLADVAHLLAEGGRARNLECVLPGPYGLDRTLLISLDGATHHGSLARIWGVAHDVTHFREAQRRLESQGRELRALAHEITLTEERARRKIAADLHDGLAQALVGMQMHVAALRRAAEQGQALPDLTAFELSISESIAHVRALMSDLMPPGLYDQGIVAGLEWLVQDFSKRERLPVEYRDDGGAKPLDESSTVLVYQATRQLLQNIVRHARPRGATVRTTVVDHWFQLDVEDNGVGFQISNLSMLPSREGGFGLFSIRERLAMIGGELGIESEPGNGTRVRVRVPLALSRQGESEAQSV